MYSLFTPRVVDNGMSSVIEQTYGNHQTASSGPGKQDAQVAVPLWMSSEEFQCKLCNRQLVDPRVLQCFHSFCYSCLRNWLEGPLTTKEAPNSSVSEHTLVTRRNSGESGLTSYENDLVTDPDWRRRFLLQCPECGSENKLPAGGLAGLPPHYIIKQKILSLSLNESSSTVFCDLCSTNIATAVTRCTYCLLNLCLFCSEAHKRQRGTSEHEMIDIRKACSVSPTKRQIMCPLHPELELSLYCIPCEQVGCRDCSLLFHRGHPCEVAARIATPFANKLRDKLRRSKETKVEAEHSLEKLNIISQRVELRCSQVEGEVDKFLESYIKAIEEHVQHLKTQIAEARAAKLQVVNHHRRDLERTIRSAGVSLKFGEDLLSEGSQIEVLTFVAPLLHKLDECLSLADSSYLAELKLLETLNFLPDERAGTNSNRPVFGVITTQRVSAAHCILAQEGLTILNNCRQQQCCEVVLLTRDCDGQPMCHGGEQIRADARYRDLSRRLVPVNVVDNQDGSYGISFTPDSPGNMVLSVTIRGVPVKGSPFPVCVRTLRPHHGTFHCCTFCSSGGRKENVCGCGGQMPGGYKGCGHGHTGHPGRRHWSCCGNTLMNSECVRPPNPLQFSL